MADEGVQKPCENGEEVTTNELEKEASAVAQEHPSSAGHKGDNFSLSTMKSAFEKCISDEGKIKVYHYMEGYDELNLFLKALGRVFGWVSSDVVAKVEIVRGHYNGEKGENYLTVQSMLEYEVANNLINRKARDSKTGTRNFLRLHRALEYIIAFMNPLLDLNDDDGTCALSQEAYANTLSKHHPWVVRKAANLAMHTLPSKGVIISIAVNDPTNKDQVEEAIIDFKKCLKAMQAAYDIVETEYSRHELLELP